MNNLIEGSHEQILAFLDTLANGEANSPEIQQTYAQWRQSVAEVRQRRAPALPGGEHG